MATFRVAKVVASLPDPIDADTIYLVRRGSGFDVFTSDVTGAVAHRSNIPDLAAKVDLPHASGIVTADLSQGDVFSFIADTVVADFPVLVDKMTTTQNTGSVNLFGGMQQDDLLILAYGDVSAGTPPAGFTVVRDSLIGDPQAWVGYKWMGAVPDTQLDLTGTDNSQAVISAYRNVNRSSPEAATHTVGLSTVGGIDPPPITPGFANSLILAFGWEAEDITGGSIANMGLVDEVFGTDAVVMWSQEQATATAFDPDVYSTVAASPDWKSVTMALRTANNGGSGLANYTLAFSNVPATTIKPIRLDITTKFAGGVWTMPANWKNIGPAAPLGTPGRYVIDLHVRDGEILADYRGQVT